jgi:hypothetical protein
LCVAYFIKNHVNATLNVGLRYLIRLIYHKDKVLIFFFKRILTSSHALNIYNSNIKFYPGYCAFYERKFICLHFAVHRSSLICCKKSTYVVQYTFCAALIYIGFIFTHKHKKVCFLKSRFITDVSCFTTTV